MARLARQIVVTKLSLRGSVSHLTDKPFALKPDVEDFLGPFDRQMRKELILARIAEAEKAQQWNRVDELRDELIEAEKAIVRMVL